jgi:GNAT superfamily N-acetyltransferase
MIRYEAGGDVPLEQMLALYESLGWRQHLYPERVARAMAASTRVVTAWAGDRLVGMARIVSDGEFCVYLPEILLCPEYQGQGLGTELMKRVLAGYEHVQTVALLADAGNDAFYERFGFQTVDGRLGYKAMTRHGPH